MHKRLYKIRKYQLEQKEVRFYLEYLKDNKNREQVEKKNRSLKNKI